MSCQAILEFGLVQKWKSVMQIVFIENFDILLTVDFFFFLVYWSPYFIPISLVFTWCPLLFYDPVWDYFPLVVVPCRFFFLRSCWFLNNYIKILFITTTELWDVHLDFHLEWVFHLPQPHPWYTHTFECSHGHTHTGGALFLFLRDVYLTTFIQKKAFKFQLGRLCVRKCDFSIQCKLGAYVINNSAMLTGIYRWSWKFLTVNIPSSIVYVLSELADWASYQCHKMKT